MGNYPTFERPTLVSRLLALSAFCAAQLLSSSALAVVLAADDNVSVPFGTTSFVYCHQNNDSLNGEQSPLVTPAGFFVFTPNGPISGITQLESPSCSDETTSHTDLFNAFQISLTAGSSGTGTFYYGIKDGDEENFKYSETECDTPGVNDDSCGHVFVVVDAVLPYVTSGTTAPAIDENSGAGQVIYTVTGESAPIIYSFAGGIDDALFTIDPAV